MTQTIHNGPFKVRNSIGEIVDASYILSVAERKAKKRAEQLSGSRHYVTNSADEMLFETKDSKKPHAT